MTALQGQAGCNECGSTRIIEDPGAGEYVCSGCGLVLGRVPPDTGPDWKDFDSGGPRASVVGSPMKGTLVGLGRDTRGTPLSCERALEMARIRRLQAWSRPHGSRDRNLSTALPFLGWLSDRLRLPVFVRKEGERLYRRALDLGLVRGRNIEGLVAACVYAACRLTGVSRTLGEVRGISGVPLRDLARGYRLVHGELGLEPSAPDPRTRINRLGKKLGLDEKTKRHAVDILSAARRGKATAGRHPDGSAAAAVYLACRECGVRVTQKAIAEAAGIAGSTLRNTYRSLELFMEDPG